MTIVQGERSRAFAEQVVEHVRRIPRGRITSYGVVAALAGRPRAARGVGSVLSSLPRESDVPWWRVVNRMGAISTSSFSGLAQMQRDLLEREGVVFDERGQASWQEYGWRL